MFRSTIFPDPTIKRDLHKEVYDFILTHHISEWTGDAENVDYIQKFRETVGEGHFAYFLNHNLLPEHKTDKALVGGTILPSGPSVRPVFEFKDTPDPKPIPKPGPPDWNVRFDELNQKLDALLRLAGVDIQ
jgi:hypothetical protein